MKEEIRVGLIGANKVGLSHANGIAIAGNGIKLTAVSDIVRERAETLAKPSNAAVYTDYLEMLKKEKMDVVIVATPHSLHCEQALNVVNQGFNLLLEKPVATNIEDAYKIAEACKKNNVKVSISHVHRFRQELQSAKKCILEGRLGNPYLVMDFFGITGGTHIPSWVYEKELSGGGVLMYGAIHDFDWTSWLLNSRVKEVYCETIPSEIGHGTEKAAICTLYFENGVIDSLTAGNTDYMMINKTRSMDIYGTDAMLRVTTGESFYYNGHDTVYEEKTIKDNPFQKQIQEFAAAIREDRSPWITMADGLHSLAVCLACYEASATKKIIPLNKFLNTTSKN